MTESQTASERITEEATSWPGVERGRPAAAASSRSGSAGARSATCTAIASSTAASRRPSGRSSSTQGRIDYHPVFPGKPGYAARAIESEADVVDVIAMLRLNYDRGVARHGLPAEEATIPH